MITDNQLFAVAAALAAYRATLHAADDATALDGQPRHDVKAEAWRNYRTELARIKVEQTFSGLRAA